MLSFEFIILASAVFLLAGSIKGTVGIGLPTAAIGILTQFTDARLAISLVVFPMLVSNAWQVYREGKIMQTLRNYWRFALALMLLIAAMSFVTARIDERMLVLILGIVILLFSLANLIRMPPRLPQRFDALAQWFAGTLAGVLGGITAIWAPPTIIYLMAKRVDKNEFVRASGLLIFLGSIPLCIGFWHAGLLGGDTALLSLAMIVPTLAGFSLGELIRRRLRAERFRKLVLLIFLVIGLNLIGKAILL